METLFNKAIAIVAIVCAIVSCEKSSPVKDEGLQFGPRVDIVLTKSEEEILTVNNSFAVNLFVAENGANEIKNKCISPLSANIALMMLANGATGEVYDDLVKGMGLEGFNLEDMNSLYKVLLEGLQVADTSAILRLANSVWCNKYIGLKDSYKTSMEKIYSAKVESIDFSQPESKDVIDGWCKEETGGLVDDITSNIDGFEDLDCILANALYFKGTWSSKFNKSETKKEKFTTLSGERLKKDFMHQVFEGYYCRDENGTEYCCLPFGNGAYNMKFIMPEESSDFKEYVNSLTYKKMTHLEAFSSIYDISISLPKFESDYTVNLLDIYKEHMDFGESFKSMYDKIMTIPVQVSGAHQRSKITINEDGGEAASISDIELTFTSPGYSTSIKKSSFCADRPFIFYITEESTGAILFMGLMTD